MPECLLLGHEPFTWGETAKKAFEVVLEVYANMADYSLSINSKFGFPDYVLGKHLLRKHGRNAYYEQK